MKFLVALGLSVLLAPLAGAAAVNDTATVQFGRKVLIPVLANDSAYQSPPVMTIITQPTRGTVSIDSAGRILYTNTSSATTTDTFRYSVKRNGLPTIDQADVNITLTGTLRIAGTFNVPTTPPPTTTSVTAAFGTLAFSQPVCIASPPGDTSRLFVCEKTGLLRIIPNVTAATPVANTFLNLPSVLTGRSESIATDSEMGLLSIAFHPNYAFNRQFFLFYSVNKGGLQYERVSRFTAQEGNPNLANTTQEILIEQLDEEPNHNGGSLQFGPDGYLYVSLGDEGGQNDSENNSQRIDKDFFSGILRIDVDKKAGNLQPNPHPSIPDVTLFSVPKDNPFVHTTSGGSWDGTFNGAAIANLAAVRTEFWAVGMRNPWRMSFDSATGELWVGDVGQNAWEEIDVVTRGGNYGWAYYEGTHDGPKIGSKPTGFTQIPPIWEYGHGSGVTQGNSITGGLVYRGTRFSALTGAYFFADYQSGNIWSLRRNGASTPTVTRIAGEAHISAFGTDPSNGDILLADLDGSIRRIITSVVTNTFPTTLADTGIFADSTDLSPAPGLLPYSVNLPFWSDYGQKKRWFYIPPTSTATWSQEEPWTTPTGSFWVKHFDLEMQRGVPSSAKRIETRIFVRSASGDYGVSYRWNDLGTTATLVVDAGEDFNLNITDGGVPKVQRWHIPSRAECMACHSPAAGRTLSFNTRQLNLSGTINDQTGNQLSILKTAGLFSNTSSIPSPNLLPRHLRADETTQSLEARVRSYLAVNCSYCHQPGAGSSANWDGRAHLILADTGLINGNAVNNGGDPLNKLIVPGNSARSVVYNRVAVANGFTRMPPLATNELDQASITMLQSWINGDLPSRETYAMWRQVRFGSSSDGDPAADPDHDGRSNHDEFLAGTSPTLGNGFLTPTVKPSGGNAILSFSLPANRSYQVQISQNLQTWTPWDIPGNGGLAHPGGTATLTGPVPPSNRQFFRLFLKEN